MIIRVFLVDDHAILREGLRLILESQPDIIIVGEATNGREAVQKISGLQAHIVLMDVGMAELNGIEATAQIRKRCPEAKVIILSMYSTSEHARHALQAGAKGYLLKESLGREVIEAVRRVFAGERYFSPRIHDILLADVFERKGNLTADSLLDPLSSREKEVLQLLVEGHSEKQIAVVLGISPKTVNTYRNRLMEKLNVNNLPALVLLAHKHGMIPYDGLPNTMPDPDRS